MFNFVVLLARQPRGRKKPSSMNIIWRHLVGKRHTINTSVSK